jgi:hypothetical protein
MLCRVYTFNYLFIITDKCFGMGWVPSMAQHGLMWAMRSCASVVSVPGTYAHSAVVEWDTLRLCFVTCKMGLVTGCLLFCRWAGNYIQCPAQAWVGQMRLLSPGPHSLRSCLQSSYTSVFCCVGFSFHKIFSFAVVEFNKLLLNMHYFDTEVLKVFTESLKKLQM